MLYVPTISSSWARLDLSNVTEVLLTPRSIKLPVEPELIMIDNGLSIVNRRAGYKHRLSDHIAICTELVKDSRCVFILPDLERDELEGKYYLHRFLQEVRPKRFSVVEVPWIRGAFPNLYDYAEFLSIPSRRATQVMAPLNRYHLLGARPTSGARSWDDPLFDQDIPLRDSIKLRTANGK